MIDVLFFHSFAAVIEIILSGGLEAVDLFFFELCFSHILLECHSFNESLIFIILFKWLVLYHSIYFIIFLLKLFIKFDDFFYQSKFLGF